LTWVDAHGFGQSARQVRSRSSDLDRKTLDLVEGFLDTSDLRAHPANVEPGQSIRVPPDAVVEPSQDLLQPSVLSRQRVDGLADDHVVVLTGIGVEILPSGCTLRRGHALRWINAPLRS
jgi:hypothetical protein